MPREPGPWRDAPWVLVMAGRDPGEAWNSGQYNGHQGGAGAETGDRSGKKMVPQSLHVHSTSVLLLFSYLKNVFTNLDLIRGFAAVCTFYTFLSQ